jgi:hypothetical protein
VTAESPEVNIPAASARLGDKLNATSPAIRAAGLEASQVPFNAAEKSIDATRRRLLVEPARNAGRVGGLGGGVVIRQVLARFPVQIETSGVISYSMPCFFYRKKLNSGIKCPFWHLTRYITKESYFKTEQSQKSWDVLVVANLRKMSPKK